MRTRLIAALAFLVPLIAAETALADELAILSAAALRPALIQVPPLFEKATGHHVTVGFGNATAIRNKITAGEKGDIIVLPPPEMNELGTRGLIDADTRFDLGVVRLGIAGKAGSGTAAIATPEDLKRALISAVSYGMPDPADGSTSSRFLVKMMEQLGITEAMRAKTRLFPDGTKALEAVAKGELALTIAPLTSIATVAGVSLVAPLPEALQVKTVYAAALAKTSAGSPAAKALLQTLKSPEVRALFLAKGVDAP